MADNSPQNGNSFDAENQDNHNENKNVELKFDLQLQNTVLILGVIVLFCYYITFSILPILVGQIKDIKNKKLFAKTKKELQINYINRYKSAKTNDFFLAGYMNKRKCSLSMNLLPNNNIIISGGNNEKLNSYFEIFNTENGLFKEYKLPAVYSQPRNSLLLPNNNVLINDSFIYNYKNDSFINIFNKKDFSKDSYSTSFMYSENQILINEYNNTYIYNIDTNKLQKIDIKFPKLFYKQFIKMNQNEIVIYGKNDRNSKHAGSWTTEIYLWNIKRNSFKKIALENTYTNATVVKLNNEELIVFGNSHLGGKEQFTEKININTKKSTKLPNSIINRKNAPLAILLSNKKIFLMGGETSSSKGKMIAEIFDPQTNQYKIGASYQSFYLRRTDFCKPSILELANKDILICGGMTETAKSIQNKCIILKMEK